MTSAEIAEWMAYAQLEPFGEERADLRAGIIASTIANVHRDPKQRKKPYTAEEFMPKFERQEKSPQSVAEKIKAVFMMLKEMQDAKERASNSNNR